MKKKVVLGLFILFAVTSANGGEKTTTLARQILPQNFRFDQGLSLDLSKGQKGVDSGVYLSNDRLEVTRSLLEAKGIRFKEVEKGGQQREGLPGLKDLKASAESQGIEGVEMVPDYRIYSGRLEDGSTVILSSHYFDSEAKRWIKKTNVTLILPFSSGRRP